MRESQKLDNRILLLLALCGVLMHILLNGQYGFHRDELDVIMNARQLDWGYVAYPPLTPFIARLELLIFGESLRGLRIFPAIAQGVVMVLTGMIARDMGGKRNAQILAAFVVFIAPIALMAGTWIMYFGFDYLWWVLVAFFVVRLLATEEEPYWLGIGLGIGLGMQTKFTMVFWVIALMVAVLLTPARKYLRSKWLYMGAGLALLIYLPNLLWQIQHDFISLDFLTAIHTRDVRWGRADDFLIEQLYGTTNPLSLPIWILGLGLCWFSASMKRFKMLSWMYVTVFLIFLINKGRAYYVAPAYVMLLSAGSVGLENWLEASPEVVRRWGRGFVWSLQILGGLIGILVMKPVVPINSPLWEITSSINEDIVEMVGWQDLTTQVAAIYESIPESEKTQTVILAGNYGEAGALELYGKQYHLPRVISGSNSLWYRGYGKPEPKTLIMVGFESSYATNFFSSCKYADTVTNSYRVKNEETSFHNSIYICRDPRRPWEEMWQEMQWFQ